MMNTLDFIFTTQPGLEAVAMNEILKLDNGAKLSKRLSQGVGLVSLQKDFSSFTNAISSNPFIFIRHIHPVHVVYRIEKDENLDVLVSSITEIATDMDKNLTFSVQSRIFSPDVLFKGVSINEAFATIPSSLGFTQDTTNPEQIISIVITGDCVYAGLSTPEQNRSNWSGGNIRFLRDGTQISRAGYKLMEALCIFSITLPHNGNCLDLGAAPGGWTNILLKNGLHVTAVDPAELDEELAMAQRLTHKKMTAQQYFATLPEDKFDIITNDMKMNADESIDIIIAAKQLLNDGGMIIMTLKLAEKNIQRSASRAISILKKHFTLLHAQQLFHNRNEVTVVLRSCL